MRDDARRGGPEVRRALRSPLQGLGNKTLTIHHPGLQPISVNLRVPAAERRQNVAHGDRAMGINQSKKRAPGRGGRNGSHLFKPSIPIRYSARTLSPLAGLESPSRVPIASHGFHRGPQSFGPAGLCGAISLTMVPQVSAHGLKAWVVNRESFASQALKGRPQSPPDLGTASSRVIAQISSALTGLVR